METENTDRGRASDIERAKALKRIRAVASNEQYDRISRELLSEDEATTIAAKVDALSEEDDFALLCRMMRTATHVVPLEQRPIVPSDSIVPDFMVRFQPGLSIKGISSTKSEGFKCFVEVKTTKKLKYRIGGSLLKRRRNFAKTFGLPLLFAVRFLRFRMNAYWVIVHDDDWTRTSVSMRVEDLFSSLRHVLFDEYWYMVLPGTRFQCVYQRGERGSGAYHPEYGSQVEFRILSKDRPLVFRGDEASIWSAFFVPYQLEEVDVRFEGDTTLRTLRPGISACSIVDLVYSFNRLPTDRSGNRTFDPSRIITCADGDLAAQPIADRKTIDGAARRMQKLGVLLLLGVGEPEEHALLWRKYGGRA